MCACEPGAYVPNACTEKAIGNVDAGTEDVRVPDRYHCQQGSRLVTGKGDRDDTTSTARGMQYPFRRRT